MAMGFGKFQVLVLGYAGMAWISEAMEMMLLSFVGPALSSSWGLSANQQALLTTVVFAGMLVGAYSWGIVSDRHGRRSLSLSLFPILFMLVSQSTITKPTMAKAKRKK